MITSPSNALIKDVRRLRRRGSGRDSGFFLVEGIHLVGALMEAEWPLESVLYSDELLTSDYGRRLVERVGKRATEVSAAILKSISGKDNPQGILGIARRRVATLDSLGNLRYGAAVTSPQDPGNVGTILRTLEAVGGSPLLLLDGGVDPYHPTAVRAAMGTTFVIPIVEAGFEEFDRWRRARGVQLIGSSAHAMTDYRAVQPSLPWILLAGSEQKGLSEAQQRACDVVVKLPMRGEARSLNLAVASAILLFQYAAPSPV